MAIVCSHLSTAVYVCNFVINEFNPTFEVQNMGNKDFQNALFGNASFLNEALSYSYLWAKALYTSYIKIEMCWLRNCLLGRPGSLGQVRQLNKFKSFHGFKQIY